MLYEVITGSMYSTVDRKKASAARKAASLRPPSGRAGLAYERVELILNFLALDPDEHAVGKAGRPFARPADRLGGDAGPVRARRVVDVGLAVMDTDYGYADKARNLDDPILIQLVYPFIAARGDDQDGRGRPPVDGDRQAYEQGRRERHDQGVEPPDLEPSYNFV